MDGADDRANLSLDLRREVMFFKRDFFKRETEDTPSMKLAKFVARHVEEHADVVCDDDDYKITLRTDFVDLSCRYDYFEDFDRLIVDGENFLGLFDRAETMLIFDALEETISDQHLEKRRQERAAAILDKLEIQ